MATRAVLGDTKRVAAFVFGFVAMLAGCGGVDSRTLSPPEDASVDTADGAGSKPPDGSTPDRSISDLPDGSWLEATVPDGGSECTSEQKSCVPRNPCHVGVLTCADGGAQSCDETSAMQADGTSCGEGKVCSAGQCIACDDGASCMVAAKPCRVAKISCSTGKAVCTEVDNAPAGSTCGSKMVCSNGDCVACVEGATCAVANRCHNGTLSCAGAAPQCVDQNTNLANGTACGTDQVCNDGSCAACKAGATCSVTNPCRTGTLACNTGSPICLESGNAANGANCGAGKVCKDGACTVCEEGASCTPTNACHQGRLSCAGGTPTCVDTMAPISAGTSCDTDKVCNQGTCVACPSNRACTPDGMTCKVGTTSCATGSSVCTATGNAANGLSCGNNMVCNAGSCIACAAGASCAPSNPCHTGTLACTGGTPSCTDTGTALGNGTTCGTNLVCSSGNCVTCTANNACVPGGNVCKTGVTSCATGTSTCTVTGNATNGASCGANMVCNNGNCMACAAGSACQPANPCHTGTLSCAGGTPTCSDSGTSLANGTGCGTNLVCSNGSCVSCTSGAACSPAACKTGAISCTSGTPTCVANGNTSNGSSCGTNLVCSNGTCNACTAGASCTPAVCKTGTYLCNTGTPVCNTNGNVGDGAPCGAGAVCYQGACRTPDCSGASSCGGPDGAGGFCTGGSGKCLPKPNTSWACNGSMCNYSCNRNPFTCSTGSAPACGSWTFESGTSEGWTLRPTSTVSGTPTSVTTFANEGTHSLAVSFSAPSFSRVSFGVSLCPNGSAISLIDKVIHAAVRFERTSGDGNPNAYFAIYNGATEIAAWADATIAPGAGWVQMTDTVGASFFQSHPDALTEFQLIVTTSGATAGGTLYIDDITIQ